MKLLCCDMECAKEADWVIVFGHRPDDLVEACSDHVGELLVDAKVQTIYQIGDSK